MHAWMRGVMFSRGIGILVLALLVPLGCRSADKRSGGGGCGGGCCRGQGPDAPEAVAGPGGNPPVESRP